MNGNGVGNGSSRLADAGGALDGAVLDAGVAAVLAEDDAAEAVGAAESARDAVRRVIADEELTQAAVAKECGLTSSVLSSWLGGRYPGDNEGVEAKVVAWLAGRGERLRAQARLPQPPGWVATPTATKIQAAIGYAHTMESMSLVVTVPGCGKTATARAYQARHPNVWLATMSPTSAGVVPALEEIAETVGVRIEGGARRLEKAIARRVRDTAGVLLVDEGQHLSEPAFDAIRSVHDATGVGVCYLGNEALLAKIAGGRRPERTAQLSSRVGYRTVIRRTTAADVAALLDAWGVRGRLEREYLTAIGTRPGGLRAYTKTLQLASVLAGTAGEALTRAHLERAWQQLGVEA